MNLTLWRQGGYLQWLTERECFDSARALAEGDCNLAETGLSAERLLNIITLRLGQLVMYWDIPAEEGVSEAEAFAKTARKARILQGICRSVLAIHRIQSQSPRQKSEPTTSSPNSLATSEESAPSSLHGQALVPPSRKIQASKSAESRDCGMHGGGVGKGRAIAEFLSGPITPSSIPSKHSQTPSKPDLNLSEILAAV